MLCHTVCHGILYIIKTFSRRRPEASVDRWIREGPDVLRWLRPELRPESIGAEQRSVRPGATTGATPVYTGFISFFVSLICTWVMSHAQLNGDVPEF